MNRNRYTANTAAFQGAKQFSRREALASIAALGLVSSSFAAHAATVIAEAPSALTALIQEHREAERAWSDCYEALCDAEERLADSLKADPIKCRLVGHGNPTHMANEIGEFADNVVQGHTSDCMRALMSHRVRFGVDDLPAAVSEILANETENYAIVHAGNVAVRERQVAFGVIDAEVAEIAASKLEKDALQRLLAFRPATMEEVVDRFHYLMSETIFQHNMPSEDEFATLFGSMMTRHAGA